MVFHRSLSDSKSPQVSRTRLRILAVLNNAVIWIVSTRPPTSKIIIIIVIIIVIISGSSSKIELKKFKNNLLVLNEPQIKVSKEKTKLRCLMILHEI